MELRRFRYCLLLASALAFTAPAYSQTLPDGLLAKAEEDGAIRVIARVAPPRSGQGIEAQRAAVASIASRLAEDLGPNASVEPLGDLPLTVIETDAEGLEALVASGLVESVVEDELAEPFLAQSGPLIHGPDAWNAGFTGAGQTVAVLDTGIEASHPFLAGKVVSQACYSTTSAANGGSVSLCPDGSGEQTGGNSGADCPTSISGCGHGTHVAGIAAGKGASFLGVAPDARLIAVKVFSRFNSAETCAPRAAPCVLAYTSDQIKGLDRVRALAGSFQIASVNMSLGGGKTATACDTDTRKPVIDQLRALGIATVIASGNNGFDDGIGFPSCISSAISVGSTTKTDTVSGFSNSAPILDLLAPGSSINSSVVGGGFGVKSGTSMATPQVAGAFAVLKSAKPGASVTALLNDLETNGVNVTGKGVTKPRIDLAFLKDFGTPPASGPLAYGTVWFDGSKRKGTPNWSSTYNATYNRYEVSIAGQNYYYLNYATIVTPAGDTRFCRSSSVGGKLLVYCNDADGRPATSRFGFVTYRD
jgi:subtilisin family serine protease